MLSEVKDYLQQGEFAISRPAEDGAVEAEHSDMVLAGPPGELAGKLHFGEESYSTIASWIRQPPVSTLEVRFTHNAERELKEFVASDSTGMSFLCHWYLGLISLFLSLFLSFSYLAPSPLCIEDKVCAKVENKKESGHYQK